MGRRTAATRSEFLRCVAAAAGAAFLAGCEKRAEQTEERMRPARIIDTHTHFYDPTRPQGVPWPPKTDATLYRTVLPQDYRSQRVLRHADATVVVEASSWVEDNQWILDLAEKDPFIIGLVGNLPVGTDEFPALLKRFAANKRFRGLRVHEPGFKANAGKRVFVEHLALLPKYDLEFDANISAAWLPEVAKIAREIPDLRIAINHVANVKVDGQEPPEAWRRGMAEAAACRNVYCKFSGLVEGSGKRGGHAPRELSFYRKVLDVVWEAFGEDRLIFGSNWPVSDHFAPLQTVQWLALEYVGEKGDGALEKVFWKNAEKVYKCRV